MKVKYGIYRILNLINHKMYVGQGKLNSTHRGNVARLVQHKSDLKGNRHRNQHLQNAFNKYGEQNFVFEDVLECDYVNLDEFERHFIKTWRTTERKYGYNYEDGGNNNKHLSEETKRKLSIAHKGKILTEEHKHNLWLSCKNSKYVKQANLNKVGVLHTEEHKNKISEGLLKIKARPVNQYSLDGQLLNSFPSIISAVKSLNRPKEKENSTNVSIIQCCSEKHQSAYGFRWSYA